MANDFDILEIEPDRAEKIHNFVSDKTLLPLYSSNTNFDPWVYCNSNMTVAKFVSANHEPGMGRH